MTPKAGADMALFAGLSGTPAVSSEAPRRDQTSWSVQALIDRKPLASFPTSLAVVRVQEPGYWSHTCRGWGHGLYSVVLMPDVETEEQFDRLGKLPQVEGVARMNRLLLGGNFNSDLELRQAAARLHADMTLIYTLDTTFEVEGYGEPLTVLSLGLLPNKQARVTTTASAVLLDTRNGYLYSVLDATEKHNQIAHAWTSGEAVDQSRRQTEEAAFEKLVGEFEDTWGRVVKEYSPTRVSAGGAALR